MTKYGTLHRHRHDCQEKCIQNVTCNYFSYEGTIGNCYLMFELELKQPTSKDKDEKWACGYFPKRVWYKSVEDERLLVKFNNCDAAFMSSLMVNLSNNDQQNIVSFVQEKMATAFLRSIRLSFIVMGAR